MANRFQALIVAALATMPACNSKGYEALNQCIGFEQFADYEKAVAACKEAVAADPNGKPGQTAAAKLPELEKKLAEQKAAAEKIVEAKKAEDAKQAAAAAAAQAAQVALDAKCTKWVTICTIGRWPDGSEKTTGRQTFSNKGACESAGTAFGGIPCDPCRCND